ncbi:BPSS1780 family membrane protein [Comamonas sp. GB3 AK4-5]|uniref:BPSS1780 family membrane protein n=1 Tax=Comamonas sp. GB3 AK4-5 TaxID=3231487 RepID=UPI00351DF9F6
MKLNIVPAATGTQWVKLGIQTFWRHPMALSALFLLCMAAMSLVTLFPLIGPALALAMLPTASLVMMVGAAETLQGRMPTPALLLVAFHTGRQRLHAMAQLGVFYAVGFLLVMGLSALIDDGQFAQVYLGQIPMTPELAQQPEFQTAMWCAMLLYLPLSLLFWHAPGLVHWHAIPPTKALFFSFVACWRNLGAFVVFFLSWVGVFIVAGLVLALLTALLSTLVGNMAAGLMVAAAMVLAAMFFTSVVFTFRDCFSAPDGDDELEADDVTYNDPHQNP